MNIKVNFPLLLATLFFSVTLFAEGKSEPALPPGPTVGTIVYMEGNVSINGAPADFGDTVESSDSLSTGAASYCEIVFDRGNIFTLEENTVTVIDWDRGEIKLEQGAMAALFTKLEKVIGNNKDFTIQTPTVAAGIRGTAFFIKVEDRENSYLCICNGALNVTGADLDKGIESDHHKAYRFTQEGQSVNWSNAPLLYHDDPKMDGVAQKIGEKILWGNSEYY